MLKLCAVQRSRFFTHNIFPRLQSTHYNVFMEDVYKRQVLHSRAARRVKRGRNMNETIYRFEAVLQKVPDLNGAYVEFPYDCLLYTS